MLDAELSKGKPKQGQGKYWRYVSPQRTYFAWLPENLARTFCSNARMFMDKYLTVKWDIWNQVLMRYITLCSLRTSII